LLISTNNLSKRKLNVAIVGARADGHAGSILDTLSYFNNINVVAFFDNSTNKVNKKVHGIPVIGNIDKIPEFNDIKIDAIHVAIGDNKARFDIYRKLEMMNLQLISIIHPTAILSRSAKIGEGCFIGANAIIQNNVSIDDYSIINTGAIIEHDNVIGKAVHLAPSACTAGRVIINDLAFIGIGALIVPDITIGYSVFINAGVVVKKNVEDGLKMVGYSAKTHSKNIYLDSP
jgi:sugar O-acyltransferase (sialic acid O-acetyltransferase NeuD family)